MHNAQFGGPIGPLLDVATGRTLAANVRGRYTFVSHANPAQVSPQLSSALVAASQRVISAKLAHNQVVLQTLAQSLPHFVPEIIAQAGAAALGAQIQGLELAVDLGGPVAAPGAQPLPPDPNTQLQNRMKQIASDRLDPRNYEVKARIDIGGFRINASSESGLDTDGLAAQATSKVRSEVVWWGIGCVVVGLVVVGALGLGFWIWREAKTGTAAAEHKAKEVAAWDGKSELSCGGSDEITIEKVHAKLDKGTAITAGANCKLTLIDVEIDAPIAIQAGGSAKITIKGGSLTGKEAAIKALGNADVTLDGTQVTGKKEALGAAKIH